MTIRRRRLSSVLRQRAVLIFAALLVGIIGYSLLQMSSAAGSTTASEAEAGTVSAPARTLDSTTASGGKAVLFGQASTGTCTPPSPLTLQDQDPKEDPIKPWRRSGPELVIYFQTTSSLTAEWVDYVNQAAQNWSASECIDARVSSTCPSGFACVPVTLSNSSDGDTLGVYSFSENNSYMTKGSLTVYGPIHKDLPASERLLTVVHEIGHAVSMAHRATKSALMYRSSAANQSPKPDAIDMHNLRAVYGPASATQAQDIGPTVTKEIKDPLSERL